MKPVISLYDFTGVAVRPWADAGHTCWCFDIQHPVPSRREKFGKGWIVYVHWNADAQTALQDIVNAVGPHAAIVFGFPPCDDLAGCGAKHWASKLAKDPHCQDRAVNRAKLVQRVGIEYGCPYLAENPSGALSRLWRRWDYTFHPHQYGLYIPWGRRRHPLWPEYIPMRDAYKKLTCLWTGNGFVMPVKMPVKPEILNTGKAQGSRQFAKLGGRSLKTKNIRSASPRGFFQAVFEANRSVDNLC